MNSRTSALVALCLLLTFGVALHAQEKPELKAYRVVVQNGKETLLPGDKMAPGDLLEYRASYKNTLKTAIEKVNIDVPVPPKMVFEPNAALKAPTSASTGDGKFSPLPLKRKVERGGATVEETVPLSEYRTLRWTIPSIAPGASVEVKARMRLHK